MLLMNLKSLILPCYWFGEIYVNTNGATKTYNGTPLTASGECHSQYNNELFQTRIDFKVTGTRTEVGSSVNTYSLAIYWPRSCYRTIIEDLELLTIVPAPINPDPPGPTPGGNVPHPTP